MTSVDNCIVYDKVGSSYLNLRDSNSILPDTGGRGVGSPIRQRFGLWFGVVPMADALWNPIFRRRPGRSCINLQLYTKLPLSRPVRYTDDILDEVGGTRKPDPARLSVLYATCLAVGTASCCINHQATRARHDVQPSMPTQIGQPSQRG